MFQDIEHGVPFKTVQKEIFDLLEGRILVGHALNHDLKVLFLNHPKAMIRDTASYKPFRDAFGGKTPSLKRLSERMLGVQVQEGEHSSVQDAQAAVRLYTMFRKEWEKAIVDRRRARRAGGKGSGDGPKRPSGGGRSSAVPSVEQPKKKSAPVYQDSDSE